jgi:hypothetical protein
MFTPNYENEYLHAIFKALKNLKLELCCYHFLKVLALGFTCFKLI